MSAVAALKDAIALTDAAVVASRPRLRVPQPAARKATPGEQAAASTRAASAKVAQTALALASLSNPLLAFGKLLTGSAQDDWVAFRDSANAALSGKTDSAISPTEFASLVTKFVSLRAALAQSGVSLPTVAIPQLTQTSGIPVWVYALLGIAAIGGVILWRL